MRWFYDKMPKQWQIKYHQEAIKHLRAKERYARNEKVKEQVRKSIEERNKRREKLLSEPKLLK